MKKIATFAVVGLMAAAPFAASALSLTDLQAQFSALAQRFSGLTIGVSSSATSSAAVSTSGSSAVSARICAILNRNLSRGSQGDDVSSVQEFLQREGYFSGSATGYFGPVTAQALAKWQSSQGISAVGILGPQTRGRIKTWCGAHPSATLSADPQSGAAPLSVTFTTSVSINTAAPTIQFGDGATSTMGKGSCIAIAAIVGGQGGIRCSYSAAHTYSSNGTYTARTSNGGATSVTVGATDTQKGSLSASTDSGAAPLPVAFTYSPAQEGGEYYIDYGDGAAEKMTAQQIYCIRAPCINPAKASHTYTSAGTYTVTVSPYIGCMYSNPRCMIAVMPLATTTITVTKGDTVCTQEYAPVCGRPAGCANTCAPGMACPAICQLYPTQTYSNRCMMNAAGATYVSDGACTSTQ